ncbi:hypothetical protein K1W54_01775, partial [Micromonospora sp. CPCC 205371]|nr:hypothetical protein [Micromonospora sp. CPCC 205371]
PGAPPGGGGPGRAGTGEKTHPGAVARMAHPGFPEVDDMFRIVTVGWAQMLLSLKAYLETGRRKPFFDF